MPEYDKQTNVLARGAYSDYFQHVSGWSSAANEGDVKAQFDRFVEPVHSSGANGRNGAPLPTDRGNKESKQDKWNPRFRNDG